jgi:hypothetical protein
MKRDGLEIFGIVFIVLFTFITLPHDSSADTLTVYGPETYIRGKGGPITVTNAFTVLNTDTTYTLKIYNSGLEADEANYKQVSSLVISLNGIQVVGPNEFNQNISLIEKPVTLLLSNEISVELRGKPGGAITVVIEGLVMVSVPSLLGLSQTEAEVALTEVGLTIGAISEQYAVILPTGVVISQNPASGTGVSGGAAVDLVLVKPPPAGAGEIIPDTWAGEWRFTITYRNASTNNIDSVVRVTNAICTADPVGLTLLELVAGENTNVNQAGCVGSASENRIEASCTGQIIIDICTVDTTSNFAMDLNGDTLAGTGSWSVTDVCGLPLASVGQTFDLSGIRLNTDPGVLCDPPQSSLLQKFMRNQLFIFLKGQL